jgi:hypothetical protein
MELNKYLFVERTQITLILQKTYFFENQIISYHASFSTEYTVSSNRLHKGFLNTKDIDSVQADLGLK